MSEAADDDTERPISWLAMGPIEGRRYGYCGAYAVLRFPRTREAMCDLGRLRAQGVPLNFSPFFRYWRADGRTNPFALESFLARNAFAPLDAAELQLAQGIVATAGQPRFYFSRDNYTLRFPALPHLRGVVLALGDSLGEHAHMEWKRGGCEIFARRNEAHRMVRAALLKAGFGLETRFFDEAVAPAEDLSPQAADSELSLGI